MTHPNFNKAPHQQRAMDWHPARCCTLPPPPGSPGRWGFGPFSKASPASNRGERDSSRAARSVLSGGMTPRPRQQRAAPASSDPRGRAKRTTERVRGPHFCGARRSGRVTSLSIWQLEGSSPSRRVAGRSSDQPALIRLACGVQIPGPLFGQGGGGVEGTRTQTMGCCGNNQYRAEPVSSPARHFFLRRCGNGASALASNSDVQRESFQNLARRGGGVSHDTDTPAHAPENNAGTVPAWRVGGFFWAFLLLRRAARR